MDNKMVWKIIAVVELIAATVFIVLDLFIPTLIVLGLMVISLLIRRENVSIMGFKRPRSWLVIIGWALGLAVFIQLLDIGLVMPILNRLTGQTIDYSGFASLQGNLGQLLFMLAYSWTLAAVGEELVYRGYIQKLLGDLFGSGTIGVVLTIAISSVIFGLAHTEQGLVGVTVSTIDALFFCWLKRKFNNNLWATILAHGFGNTIGLVVFYFTGPIVGLW